MGLFDRQGVTEFKLPKIMSEYVINALEKKKCLHRRFVHTSIIVFKYNVFIFTRTQI